MVQQPSLLQQQVRALYDIAKAMSTTESRQAVLQTMLNRVVQDLGYRAAAVRLLDAERQTLVLTASEGLSETYLSKGAVEVAKSGVDREVLAGKTVEIRDVGSDPGFQYPEAAQREGIRGVLAVPLTARGRVIGVLRLYSAEPRDFSDEEVTFLRAVAQLLAGAFGGARLFEAFQTIVREVNSSLKLEDVLVRLLRSTIAELNYQAGLIRLIDFKDQVMRLVAAEGLSSQYLSKGDVHIGESAIDREVLQGNPLTIYDVSSDPRFQYREAAAREGIRSVQALPLSVRGNVIGVLRVYSSQPHRFSDDERTFLSAIADLGAIAIENARLHEALSEKYETLKTDSSGWYRFLTLS